MTIQPCQSLEHFLHSLDQYQNPPKRQRGESRAVRIQLPNLDSFLEINKEWLPLAKAQASAREKFGELANIQTKTRNGQSLQKRLREESIPDLPQEMLQQILNVVPYETSKELVSDFANTFEVASPWPEMARKALCEKINQEQIPINWLHLSLFDTIKFVLDSGPYLHHLDLHSSGLFTDTCESLLASCPNLTYLDLVVVNGPLDFSKLKHLKTLIITAPVNTHNFPKGLETLDLIGGDGTLPELPCLVELKFRCQFWRIKKFSMPSFPKLKKLYLEFNNLTFTLETQPELEVLSITSINLTRLHLGSLPNLTH